MQAHASKTLPQPHAQIGSEDSGKDACGVQQRINLFWRWFTENEADLSEIRLNEHGMIDECHMGQVVELSERCGAIDEDISMELESDERGAKRLIISANGIGTAFPIVEQIYECAPPMQSWDIVKYRQRQQHIKPLRMGAIRLEPQTLRFAIYQHQVNGEFGVAVFMPGYKKQHQETMNHMGFIFLDSALGEYDVATKIKTVDFLDVQTPTDMVQLTISELPEVFDALFLRSRH